MKLIKLLCCAASVLLVAGCTTSGQVSASKDRQTDTARKIVGTGLVGAQGRTEADQDKIDDTAARLCGARVWTRSECQRHGDESRRL